MEIIINNEKIDAVLENEKTLGEVFRALEKQLEQSKLIIINASVDNNEIALESFSSWAKTPIENVTRLDIKAYTISEVKFSNLETIHSYLSLLNKNIVTFNKKELEDILKGSSYMLQGLKKLFGPKTNPALISNMVELEKLLIGSTANTVLGWPEGIKNKALQIIDTINLKVYERIEEYSKPVGTLIASIEQLKSSSIKISDVSLLLQTGKDLEAMDIIIQFSDLIEKMLRLFALIKNSSIMNLDELKIEDKTVEEYFKDLNNTLSELIEAFNANDSVLIGDLLEYEIAPRLDDLAHFIEKVKTIKK